MPEHWGVRGHLAVLLVIALSPWALMVLFGPEAPQWWLWLPLLLLPGGLSAWLFGNWLKTDIETLASSVRALARDERQNMLAAPHYAELAQLRRDLGAMASNVSSAEGWFQARTAALSESDDAQRALNEFSRAMEPGLEPDVLLARALRQISTAIGASSGIAFISNADGGYSLAATSGTAIATPDTVRKSAAPRLPTPNGDQTSRGLISLSTAPPPPRLGGVTSNNGHTSSQNGTAANGPKTMTINVSHFGQQLAVLELLYSNNLMVTTQQVIEDSARVLAATLSASRSRQRVTALVESLEAQTFALDAKRRELSAVNDTLMQTQKELRAAAARAEAASAHKSEFVAMVSHELRSPLNSLLLLSADLSEDRRGELNADRVKVAQMIHRSGKDLQRLIDDVLDLAKIESGNLQIEPREVILAEIAGACRETFGHVAKEKGLVLDAAVSGTLPDTIVTDSLRLIQILRNFISNAIKFTREGSVSLIIEPVGESVAVGCHHESSKTQGQEPTTIAFSIIDTGIGLDADKLDKIFMAFSQAEASTAREYGGTGLGLSISAQLATLLGGEIDVESTPERGSRFTLLLPPYFFDSGEPGTYADSKGPAAAQRQDTQRRNDRRRTGGGIRESRATAEGIAESGADEDKLSASQRQIIAGKTVLIVDDSMRTAFALSRVLRQSGMVPSVADSGALAIDMISSATERYDVVIMDIVMPGQDGIDTLRKLRRVSGLASLPVVALSARAAESDQVQAMAAGFNDYLVKPISLGSLFAAVVRLCGNGDHSDNDDND